MAIDIIARALALSGGGGGGGGTTDYNDLSNRPQINGNLLRGNKTGEDLGLAGIEVVTELPETLSNDTIYVIPGNPSADPPVPDKFYVVEGGAVYQIVSGRVEDVDYNTEIINRPKIDDVLLKANNNTHEELELISEKDFTTAFSGRTDGMEFVLPEGTPDNPIEITEIDDSPEMKYAKNLTSSNFYINTEIDALKLLIDKKIQVLVVSELPDSFVNNTLYVIPGDAGDGTVTPGVFYLYKGNTLYLVGGSGGNVDYVLEVHNKPEIDSVELMPNQTHEDLELISEKDFVTQSTNKTDGIEFILPEGTPDNPIEISEINDTPEMKYANNLTSSNLYINTALDEINRILDGKVQVLVVDALPAQVTKNTIYFVESEQEGVYNQYIVDSLGAVHQAGNTQLNLDDYVKNTRTIGSHTLEHNITAADLVNDVKDQSATLTNKTINAADNTIANLDLSNFSSDVVKTAMPETPTDTALLTAKAVNDAIGDKQDVITDNGNYYELTDTIPVACIYKENGKLYRKSFQLIKLWGWLVQSCCSSAIPGPDNVPNLEVPTSQAVIDYVKGTKATGSDAFTYNPNTSQGYTINGDYDTNCPRQISKVGRRVNLSFCCKGSTVANSANWTSLGTVPTGYRPAKKTSITAQVYSGTQNEAAGGYVDTSGWVVIWTNPKSATNNYQVRINACWDVE